MNHSSPPGHPAPRLRTRPPELRSTQPILSVASETWPGLTLSRLTETHGDLPAVGFPRNAIIVSLEGASDYDLTLDGRRSSGEVRPDNVAAAPGGAEVAARWRNFKPEQNVLLIEFDTSLFAGFAPEVVAPPLMSGHLVPAPFRPAPGLSRLARLLGEELDPERRRGRLFAETVIRALSLEVAAHHWTARRSPRAEGGRSDRRIRRALDFIEAHHTDDISLADIAAAAALSPSHLTATFRAQTGMAPHAYVIDRRLRTAVDLLRRSNLPIAEVALAAGFCDQAHLTRAARARLGRTPAVIRRDEGGVSDHRRG
jgi:AraC family transcriptional regulator